MSMDAGGLAQMTYNHHNPLNGGLGMPSTGFASRGKGSNIKRLSVAPPSKINTIDENQPVPPRTSRSHLLAGLRTAPKSPAAMPSSAPPHQLQQPGGLNDSRFANIPDNMSRRSPPKTASSANFPPHQQNQNKYNASAMNQYYTPEQILAPPSLPMNDENLAQMDPAIYEELMRMNQHLADQQMRLQQQLINVTAAAQQFQHMNLGQNQPAYGAVSPGAGLSLYEQQLQYGLQPIIEEVPNQPGVYTVYNPMTKQTSIYHDPNHQAFQLPQMPQPQPSQQGPQHPHTYGQHELSHSPPPATPTFRAQVSPPPEPASSASTNWRSNTPPKTAPSPPRDEPAPLPATFRHRKGLSLANGAAGGLITALGGVDGGPRTAGLKSAGLPPTPMTGTFGPGQAREGEHPVRQPRGPPSLEDLLAKPTAKHEGSRNFVGRQRRSAVHSLVRAGKERRGGAGAGGAPRSGQGSMDSAHSGGGVGGAAGSAGTPTSERGDAIPVTASPVDTTDADSVRSGSASLSGQPSLGSLRGAAAAGVGAIGSERKDGSRSRDRGGSGDSYASVASEEAPAAAATAAAAEEGGRRRSNLLVLSNAEKRRSQIF